MEKQIEAFRYQLLLATKYQRPVSVHCVRAMGKILDTINEVIATTTTSNQDHEDDDHNNILPPRIYFHAFGGKASTATQLIRTLEKPRKRRKLKIPNNKNKHSSSNFKSETTKVYFGFAPLVNFGSPKTTEVIQTVGINRLVLEKPSLRLVENHQKN